MIEYNKIERQDELTEYEVLSNEWKDINGKNVLTSEPIVVGYVTKFGEKKWAFRSKKPFYTNVVATDSFKSRSLAAETGLESLQLMEETPEEGDNVIDIKTLKKLFPLPRIKNNKKRTRGRNVQHVPIKDKSGRVVSSKKIVHRNYRKTA